MDERSQPSGPLKSLASSGKAVESSSAPLVNQEAIDAESPTGNRVPVVNQSDTARRTLKRNYSTLVSALQTLGYSIPGFVATAIVTLDGHPIAQVAVDDLDISPLYGYLSTMLQGALLSLEHVEWGGFEDTVITSGDRRILLRLVGEENKAFQVLVTSRDADSLESLRMRANVAGAIAAALR
jgi:predicted regulator of Ras-like GTPase activity (Roadblock/LC7/MglB family)